MTKDRVRVIAERDNVIQDRDNAVQERDNTTARFAELQEQNVQLRNTLENNNDGK